MNETERGTDREEKDRIKIGIKIRPGNILRHGLLDLSSITVEHY